MNVRNNCFQENMKAELTYEVPRFDAPRAVFAVDLATFFPDKDGLVSETYMQN